MIPKVKIIATGGTIIEDINKATVTKKTPSAQDLLTLIPEIENIAKVEYEDFCRISSSTMTREIQFFLAKSINKIYESDPELAGIVVTHGTDSLEETAFLLGLMVDDIRPVVLTTAQRLPRYMNSDGPRNLLNSIRIAISEKARNKGVLVCLNDEINSVRCVSKTHTVALQTFNSGQYGLLGYVDEEDVFFLNARALQTAFERIEKAMKTVKLFPIKPEENIANLKHLYHGFWEG